MCETHVNVAADAMILFLHLPNILSSLSMPFLTDYVLDVQGFEMGRLPQQGPLDTVWWAT